MTQRTKVKAPVGIEKELMDWANDPFSSANEELWRRGKRITAEQAIERIRQLLMLSGSRGSDNNWLLAEIAKYVSTFKPLAQIAAEIANERRTP